MILQGKRVGRNRVSWRALSSVQPGASNAASSLFRLGWVDPCRAVISGRCDFACARAAYHQPRVPWFVCHAAWPADRNDSDGSTGSRSQAGHDVGRRQAGEPRRTGGGSTGSGSKANRQRAAGQCACCPARAHSEEAQARCPAPRMARPIRACPRPRFWVGLGLEQPHLAKQRSA